MLDLEVRRLEKQVRARLADLQALMERNPEEARKVLETLLNGPLRFTPVETPEGKRCRVEDEVGLGHSQVRYRWRPQRGSQR